MIKPHGWKLINKVIDNKKSMEYISNRNKFKQIKLDDEQIKELKNIWRWVYSPINGYMKQTDFESVVYNMRLSSGIVWSLPIVLDIDKSEKNF